MNNNQPKSYWALPLAHWLQEFRSEDMGSLEFVAADGMTAIIPSSKIFREGQAEAWLAVEPVDGHWPQTKAQKPIGPYYLVWLSPEKSGIGPEEWPYQVKQIRIRPDVAQAYPKMVPPGKLAAEHPVQQGFQVFLLNCVHCHTLNKQGPAQLGPDLNSPYNPTEYWKPSFLKLYIRNPRAVRHWPQSKMPGFDDSEISNEDLRALLSYLKHMARHRNR